MFIFDDDEDEHRKIASAEWANRKGYQVVTQLVGSEADVEQNQGYLINSELPPLVAAGKKQEPRVVQDDHVSCRRRPRRRRRSRRRSSRSRAAPTTAAATTWRSRCSARAPRTSRSGREVRRGRASDWL